MSVSCLVISTISSRRPSVCVSVCVCVCVCVYVRACAHALAQSCLTLSNPRECSPQAPLSMKFSRQEYWSVLLFPIPRDLPKSGIKPMSLVSPALAGRFFTTEPETKSISKRGLKGITCWLKSRVSWETEGKIYIFTRYRGISVTRFNVLRPRTPYEISQHRNPHHMMPGQKGERPWELVTHEASATQIQYSFITLGLFLRLSQDLHP